MSYQEYGQELAAYTAENTREVAGFEPVYDEGSSSLAFVHQDAPEMTNEYLFYATPYLEVEPIYEGSGISIGDPYGFWTDEAPMGHTGNLEEDRKHFITKLSTWIGNNTDKLPPY